MALKRLTDGVTLHIPQPHGLVSTATDNGVAIGAKDHGPDRSRMALKRLTDGVTLHIPQPHGLVRTATDNGVAIGAKGHGQDRIRMALKRLIRWGYPAHPTAARSCLYCY